MGLATFAKGGLLTNPTTPLVSEAAGAEVSEAQQ